MVLMAALGHPKFDSSAKKGTKDWTRDLFAMREHAETSGNLWGHVKIRFITLVCPSLIGEPPRLIGCSYGILTVFSYYQTTGLLISE